MGRNPDREEFFNNVRNWLRLGLHCFHDDGIKEIPMSALEAIFGKPQASRVIESMTDIYETDNRRIGLSDKEKERLCERT